MCFFPLGYKDDRPEENKFAGMSGLRERKTRERGGKDGWSVPVTEVCNFPSDAIYHLDDILFIATYHQNGIPSLATHLLEDI